MKKFWLFFSLGLFPFFIEAAGIMGSTLTWNCIGKDSFMLKLVLFADCNQESPGNQMLSFYCTHGDALIKTVNLNNPIPVDITPSCSNVITRCTDQQSTYPYGIHEYTYSKLVVLNEAGACCEIRIELSTCCWDSAITTIKNPGNKNFYTEAILNRCTNPCDNSPYFTLPPVMILCQGTEFVMCSGGSDIDIGSGGGMIDSCVSEVFPPLSSKDSALEYIFPYSFSKPLYFDGFPDINAKFPQGFHVNNCNIMFTPMTSQQTIFNVKTTEYRNKVKIGEVNQNMYFIFTDCPPNHSPTLLTDTFFKEVLADSTVTMIIPTYDPDFNDNLRINWNHGINDETATWSSNNGKVRCPTGIFKWKPAKNKASTIPYSFIVSVNDEPYHGDTCAAIISYSHSFQILVKSPVSINKFNGKLDFSLYPNPNNGSFNISLPDDTGNELDVSIMEVTGKILFNKVIKRGENEGDIVIDHTGLSKGIYFIKIANKEIQGIGKFMVE